MPVILEVAHLIAVAGRVFLQRPVGRRGHHEMNRGVRQPGQMASISEVKAVHSPVVGFRPRHFTVMTIGGVERA